MSFKFFDERYNRQTQMPEWGSKRQKMLSQARVAVIGAGGVKSTLLMSLVAAGIGKLKIVEFDTIEISNLNRQLLYKTSDIGRKKIVACVELLKDLNPKVDIKFTARKVDNSNIAEICSGYDFIVEGGDSPHGRNLVNEYCLKAQKPFVHASAQFNYGYVFSVDPTVQSACFACFFPSDYTRTQSTGPVPVSVLPTSIAGTLGAAEVLKWFMGYRSSMFVNRKLCFSSLLLSAEFTEESQLRRLDCPVCSPYYCSS